MKDRRGFQICQKQRYFKRILTAAWLALLMDSFYPEVFVVSVRNFKVLIHGQG
jgi:hypothetical protein